MDIAAWLSSLGLERYAPVFRDNDIESEMLPQLTAEDLIALGITSVGHRRRLLAAVASFGDTSGPLLIKASSRDRGSAPARSPEHGDARPPHAERRQLTVMFVDLVSSTELSQRLDPEDMREVIRAYQIAVSEEISRYEGRVAKLMGDGVLAYFGWPQAHEDDAERAVRSGMAAAAATARLTAPGGEPLAARIGIATGLVVVGDLVGEGSAKEEAVVGDTPNLAARLQALAEPGSVVVADGTQRLVAGLFDMVNLGRGELKGFAKPVRTWRIVGETAAESRFEARQDIVTPIVGRDQELEFLVDQWHRACAGDGRVVLLSGEPGIGKSRIIAAMVDRLSAEPPPRLRYFCSPYHINSALHPVTTQVERAAGLDRNDTTDTKLDKLEALLRGIVPDVAEAIPLLATLLSIDTTGRYSSTRLPPLAQKARTLAALVQQIEALAVREPTIVLVEDAHWIDPTTGEWLDMLIDRLRNMRALLIVTFRPEFQPRWIQLSHVTALSLDRLGLGQGAAIMDRVAGGKTMPPEVASEILAKTEGVPLFVEELTKTVLDSGLLVDAGDHYVLSGPLPPLAIPSTLQDSLMSRLDRLGPVKEVAQIGACIGRGFHHRLLAAVTDPAETRLQDVMPQLEESELVFRRGVPPEATYTFKHALVRDAAYQSLLKSRRQQIHAKIAATLEAQFQEVVATEPETLAHHYTVAGVNYQAAVYWLKAGQLALKRSANLEAASHLRKGLELVGSLPGSEDRLRLELSLESATGTAMIAAKGWGAPEVLQAFSSARRLADTLRDKPQIFAAMRGESSYQTISGNLRAAEMLGHQCQSLGLELAQVSDDSGYILEAHHQLWGIYYYLGDYDASERHASHGLATYDYERHRHLAWGYAGHDPGVCCRAFSAQMLFMRGHSVQAILRSRDAMALAERDSHPVTTAQAQLSFCLVHLMRREPAEALQWAKKAITLCDEFVMPLLLGQARVYFGWALAGLGQLEEGIRQMRLGIAGIAATGADMGMAYYLCILARNCGERGDASEGLALLAQAFDTLGKSTSKYQLPELLRTRGELVSVLDPTDEAAESWFQQSLTAARDQGAKSSELRAALRLTRLYAGQGRNDKARHILAPVHASFTEGFDTPDLVESKGLLRMLSHSTERG
ncbi:AAA family ATPase [Mesorhizobium sp. M1088]|uniref:adenylate/guanylate cyclase domain-containing protein n=1 Tax=unclassified Mesorhizobium TaxID=325217 RepID=UPI0033362239